MGTHRRTTSGDAGAWEAEDPEEVFAAPPRTLTPEERLRWDVLVDAIQLVSQLRGGHGSRREIRDAALWILSTNRAGLFAFENLAEDFGLDAKAVRTHLQRRFNLRQLSQKPSSPSKVA